MIIQIIKEIWRIMPFSFFIGLLARLTIASVVILYLDSIEGSSLFITIILNLWALMPVYYSIRNTYYDFRYSPGFGEGSFIWALLSTKLDRNYFKRVIWIWKGSEKKTSTTGGKN